MYGLTYQPDRIFINSPEGFTSEDAKKFVQEYNEINGSTDFRTEQIEVVYLTGEVESFQVVSASGEDITSAGARDICNFLKEKGIAKDCYYTNTLVSITESYIYTDSLAYYYLDIGEALEEKRAALQNYIEENNYDWTVRDVSNENALTVVPNYEATVEEQMEMVNKIYGDLGYSITWITLCSDGQVSDKVDVLNSIDGDANNDGTVSLADVITIMQSVGNLDEYSLDPQQKFNADVYGSGDGITNMDALTIQRRILGLE